MSDWDSGWDGGWGEAADGGDGATEMPFASPASMGRAELGDGDFATRVEMSWLKGEVWDPAALQEFMARPVEAGEKSVARRDGITARMVREQRAEAIRRQAVLDRRRAEASREERSRHLNTVAEEARRLAAAVDERLLDRLDSRACLRGLSWSDYIEGTRDDLVADVANDAGVEYERAAEYLVDRLTSR